MFEIIILLLILMKKFGRDLSGLSYDWLDAALVRSENKHGRLFWLIKLSFLMVLAACIYTRVSTHCSFLGSQYAELARNPFAFDPANPVGYRLLTPLLSYLVGLRGHGIIVINLIISGVLLAVVYDYFRKTALRPGDAFLAVVTMTFSLTVLTSIHCGGYTDIMTYLLIFLMWRYRKNRVLFYVLFFLGLLNREAVAFLIPWFVFISFETAGKKRFVIIDLILGLSLTLGGYYLYRLWIESHQTVRFSTTYYLDHLLNDPFKHFLDTFKYHSLGLFSVYQILWVFPLLTIVSRWRERNYRQIISFLLLIVCAGVQLLVARDTSRMFTLGFMVGPLALEHLFQTDFRNFRNWAFWAVLFNLVVPQVYVAGPVVEVWRSLSIYLFSFLW
ncbi:MAG: hypothetical protein JXA92_07975 [candidate division Zixibacteria bacterium]|nr:hypothetical protein [candidate division Zixibacteria bacterium]